MHFGLTKNPTSSGERLFSRSKNQVSTPIAVLFPALSNLRSASRQSKKSIPSTEFDMDAFGNARLVPPLIPNGKRFKAGQLLKLSFLRALIKSSHFISRSYLQKFKSDTAQNRPAVAGFVLNMGSEISDFFGEKTDTPSQWQAILEPCIPPIGAQVSVLRRAPH